MIKEKIYTHLSEAIKCRTISHSDESQNDFNEFKKLHSYLINEFPHVFSHEYEVINQGSLLIHIKGSGDLKPVLFMAHMDVVSVVKGTEKDWTYDAFSGHIDDEFIWGRGAIDTKCMVVGELEAIESLLEEGYSFKRDIYLAYGHDEETAGGRGQYVISQILKERGIQFEYVIDEGGTYEYGTIYGAPNQMICPIGVSEKGYLDVILSVQGKGGHSSNPGDGSTLGKLCKAIGSIESNQFKSYLPECLKTTFKKLKPYIDVEPLKTYVSDMDKYQNELIEYCYNDYHLNPFVHTTIATTMLEGGSQGANVLPQNCEALINLRTSEIDSLDDCINHFKKHCDCEIKGRNGLEPSKTSLTESYVIDKIENIVNRYIENVIAVPVLLCGGTDCRFYDDLSNMCYRFSPYPYPIELEKTVHGTNERMPKEGYYQGILMLIDLIKETC